MLYTVPALSSINISARPAQPSILKLPNGVYSYSLDLDHMNIRSVWPSDTCIKCGPDSHLTCMVAGTWSVSRVVLSNKKQAGWSCV